MITVQFRVDESAKLHLCALFQHVVEKSLAEQEKVQKKKARCGVFTSQV